MEAPRLHQEETETCPCISSLLTSNDSRAAERLLPALGLAAPGEDAQSGASSTRGPAWPLQGKKGRHSSMQHGDAQTTRE